LDTGKPDHFFFHARHSGKLKAITHDIALMQVMEFVEHRVSRI
jgi:hypothetical protein